MKLNFGRRFVLFVFWLLSMAVCALGVALFIWPGCWATAAELLRKTDVFIYAIAVLVVYLLFAAGSVAIIFGGRKRNSDRNFIIVDSSDTGRTRIAVGAVEQMIRQAVRGVAGIAEMKAGIVNNEDSIAINADVAILNGAHVPTVTSNIRNAIRGYIEQNCGVAVSGVSVSVHYLADEVKESGGRRNRNKKTKVGNQQEQTPVWNPEMEGDLGRTVPIAPVAAPIPCAVSAPVAPVPEPEPMVFEEPASEPVAQWEAPVDEAPAVEEAPAEEAAPAASAEPEPAPQDAVPAPKRGKFFGRLFGRRKGADAANAEPEASAEPADASDAGEAVAESEPAADAAEAEVPVEAEAPEEADAFDADGAQQPALSMEFVEAEEPAAEDAGDADEVSDRSGEL